MWSLYSYIILYTVKFKKIPIKNNYVFVGWVLISLSMEIFAWEFRIYHLTINILNLELTIYLLILNRERTLFFHALNSNFPIMKPSFSMLDCVQYNICTSNVVMATQAVTLKLWDFRPVPCNAFICQPIIYYYFLSIV